MDITVFSLGLLTFKHWSIELSKMNKNGSRCSHTYVQYIDETLCDNYKSTDFYSRQFTAIWCFLPDNIDIWIPSNFLKSLFIVSIKIPKTDAKWTLPRAKSSIDLFAFYFDQQSASLCELEQVRLQEDCEASYYAR